MHTSFTAFYKKCAHAALVSGIPLANSWKWLIGMPILAFILYINKIGIVTTGYQSVDIVLATFAALLITWVFIFVIRFIKAPVTLHRKLESEIIILKNTLDDKEKRQTAINRLWELRSKGISIRNEFPQTEDVYRAWQSRYMEWREEVLLEAEKVSPNLKQWLARLDLLRVEAVSISPLKDVQNMTEALARLGEYLKTEVFEWKGLQWLVANTSHLKNL